MWCLWIMLAWTPSPAVWPKLFDPTIPSRERLEIADWIYQAEVHQRVEESVLALRAMASRHRDSAWRRSLTRAIAVVTYERRRTQLSQGELTAAFADMRAVWISESERALLLDAGWFEPGDWLGDVFVLDIDETGAVVEDRFNRATRFVWESVPEPAFEPPGLLVVEADPSRVLSFLARLGGYNSFVPSVFDIKLSGAFSTDDWWRCLQMVCQQLGADWIRHGNSMVFRPQQDDFYATNQEILSLNRRDMELAEFLQIVADAFDMELVLLDPLDGMLLDVEMVDQSWNETLDCLAMMNQLHWFLVSREGEKTRLVVERN